MGAGRVRNGMPGNAMSASPLLIARAAIVRE